MYLEHVNLTVTSLERSIRFYRTLLGLELRWRGLTGDGRPAAHVGNERCYLALFECDTPDAAAPVDYLRAGFNHMAFVVEDLPACRERLLDLGHAPHFEPDYVPGRRLYLMDPDGIEVELVQYGTAEEALGVQGAAR